MFTLLHRMIFIELFRVFFLCWVGLTGLVLLAGVIAEATQQGLGPMQIVEIIPFLIPSTMPYTLPTTTLFATCVVYGRLAHDNEVLAVRASGVNVFQVVLPSLVLGGLASLGTMALYCDVIPSTHWMLRTHFTSNVEEVLYNMLRKDGCVKHPQLEYAIYAKKVEGRDLIDAKFMHRDPKGGFDMMAQGKKADLTFDKEKRIMIVRLWNGEVLKENGDRAQFEVIEFPFDMGGIFDQVKNRPTDMTWLEMGEFREKYDQEIEKFKQDIAQHEAVMVAGGAPANFAAHVRERRIQIKMTQSLITNIDAEYQMRPALALGCLCFVMVACPIGIWFSRSDYLSSFITCFLPIIIVYYPLLLCGVNMAKAGKLIPMLPSWGDWASLGAAALAIWPANLVTAVVSVQMMRRLVRN